MTDEPGDGWNVSTQDHRGIACVVVSDSRGRNRALIAKTGATLLRWRAAAPTGLVDVVDGYRDVAELQAQGGMRCAILAPFSNRVAGGSYRFQDRDHDLRWMASPSSGQVLHGFARLMGFEVARVQEGPNEAMVELRTEAIRAGAFEGYPFSVDLGVQFRFTDDELTVRITASNVGDNVAPVALGWHPYFTLGVPIDHLELRVPADRAVRTDSTLIPLPGDQALDSIEPGSEFDFGEFRPLGPASLDLCLADPHPDGDGIIRSTVRDPRDGRRLSLWQERGLVHLFTGHTLRRDPRQSIALEPVEFMTNSFNRPELAPHLGVDPGASRSFTFGVSYQPS